MVSLPLAVAARLPRWNVRWPLAIRYLQPQPTSRAQAKETNSQNGSSDETFSRNCQYHSTRKFKIPLSPLDSPALPSQITGWLLLHSFVHMSLSKQRRAGHRRGPWNSPACSCQLCSTSGRGARLGPAQPR